MASLKVYFDLMSQPSRAVILFLRINNIPHEEKPVALRNGEHLGEAYGKINPFHLVPAIDHNGFILTESAAIMTYLADVYNVDDKWYPKDRRKRALVDAFLHWHHLNLRVNCAMYFRALVIDPRMSGKPTEPSKVSSLKQRMETSLDQLENHYLKQNPYLARDQISIADLQALCEVMQVTTTNYDPAKGRPKVGVWMDRVQSQLHPHWHDANKMVTRVRESLNKSQSKV